MKLKNSAKQSASVEKAAEAAGKPAGEGYASPGLRHAQTTTLFRVTNFELYATPVSILLP